MVCDVCKENKATVHYTEIVDNKLRKMNLCEKCAKEKNVGIHVQFSVADILKGLSESSKQKAMTPEDKEAEKRACSFCGLDLGRFKKVGKVGCGSCYEEFQDYLDPILTDIHKNLQHMGKVPRQGIRSDSDTAVIETLQRRLQEAVRQEDYERAAALRDEIRSLEQREEERQRES